MFLKLLSALMSLLFLCTKVLQSPLMLNSLLSHFSLVTKGRGS